ncbi:LLM class flavin-dependent oxidoreductase [Haliangium sp.]|uniref:LLM class flavin-dependent oxidoreductase n=1 Tax=Haliangium sp. TaxID=2663208 RepID=UPI003D0EFEB2
MSDRIGLVAFWKNYDRALYVRAARLADELGYDSFWLPEAWGYESFTLLTELALNTTRIKLGTGIVNVFSRSPGLLAMSAATVDEISEGRLILGIGTSGKRVIEGFHGCEFGKPLTRIRDVIRVVRTLLAGDRLSASGAKEHQYLPFMLAMTPARRRIPIYVAALKEKSIRSIGEMADGWIPTFWPYAQMQRGLDWIAEGARSAGRDPAEITCAPFSIAIPLGGDAATRKARELIAFYIGGMGDYYKELLTSFGYGEECKRVDQLYHVRKTRPEAAAAVSEGMIEALTISGDPRHCVDELRRRRDYGIDLPILNLPTDVPWEVLEMFIRAMAPR